LPGGEACRISGGEEEKSKKRKRKREKQNYHSLLSAQLA
jgi:hypothetical protein